MSIVNTTNHVVVVCKQSRHRCYEYGTVMILLLVDYWIFVHPIWENMHATIQPLIKTHHAIQHLDTCHVVVPEYIRYITKYNTNKHAVDYAKMYKIATCIANRWMDEYLLNEVFIPGRVDPENEYALQPINKQLAFAPTNLNLDMTKKELDVYIHMSDEDLYTLLHPPQEVTHTFGFVTDTFHLVVNGLKTVHSRITHNNIGFSVVKVYARTIKDYCITQKRYLEDMEKMAKRDLEDYITRFSRLVEDMKDFLQFVVWLVVANITVVGIVASRVRASYSLSEV